MEFSSSENRCQANVKLECGNLVTEAGGDDANVLNTAKDDDENVKDNEDQIGNIVHPV